MCDLFLDDTLWMMASCAITKTMADYECRGSFVCEGTPSSCCDCLALTLKLTEIEKILFPVFFVSTLLVIIRCPALINMRIAILDSAVQVLLSRI